MSAINELRQTIARLRAPGGCPWDREQTHASLTRCLIDECSELLETIDALDMPHMREELGDVLIQVVFHAQLAEESGHFDLDDVAREVNEKLIRRHPHVFGDNRLDTSEQVLVKWEQIKAQEKAAKAAAAGANGNAQPEREKVFKDMPPRLPALMFAEAVWKQIQKKDLPHDGAVDSARVAGLAATLDDEALGRALFELAAAARAKGLDPEGALRRHATKVMSDVEKHLQQQGV
ncbi:MazG family protein [Termitidicoccus mucosus]|uniref:Nucleotide pyrophosphohydrolase n=1 Tax=Termitidicoccus mucosus TaxID=1184151 RepID=A0A178IFX4_9BACT|nr:nucleotide pyrophosphohydrolase [Opitutaceae bacterium TSB47]